MPLTGDRAVRRSGSHRRVALGAVCGLVALTVTAPVAAASAPRRPHLAVGPGLVPVGAVARIPSNARPTGQVAASRELRIGVSLRPRDPAGLAAYATAVSDPRSANFHHFLTPATFASRFGPTRAAVRAVSAGLRAAGLGVGTPSANGLLVPVSGTSARLESAFHVRLDGYAIGGRQGWAASATPLLPASWAGAVQSVVGLDNLVVPHALLGPAPAPARTGVRSALAGRATVSTTPRACAAATSAATSGGGWTDAQVAQAYGLSGLFAKGGTGAGQTIALYELEPFAMADVATFDRCYFGADHTNQISTVSLDGFNLTDAGSGESVLDVEDLSALAPAAHIIVYQAPNTTYGALDEYNAIVSQDKANVVSTSWGECESALQIAAPGAQQLENTLFEEAAAQGQSVFSASGDTGSDDCAGTPFGSSSRVEPYLSVDDPSSQPFVVSVGGTSLAKVTAPLTGANETVWNDGANWGGAGGGVSNTWASPVWQADSGVPGVATSGNRQLPDVSATADEWRGVTVYSGAFSQPPSSSSSSAHASSAATDWTTMGGTSSATPIWAAIVADIASSSGVCSSLPVTAGGRDLGFVAPELYAVAASSYATAFHDVTVGNNDVFGVGQGYGATPGYDLASGLGSPVVTNGSGTGLAARLCAVATGGAPSVTPAPAVAGLSPAFGPVTGGTSVTITGANFPAANPAALHVAFGAAAAVVQSVSATSVVVTAPAAVLAPSAASFTGAGPAVVSVTVSGPSGSVTSLPGTPSVFDYVAETGTTATPTVTGVGPSGGNVAGGNTVTVFGSGFATGGAPTVTFGGVTASNVHVVSDFELTATAPAQGSATACVTGLGFTPTAACQTEVVVTNASGASPSATILPALTGPIVFTAAGVVKPTPETEVAPVATEYDYAPTPTITSISPNPAADSGASPVVITGTGFSLATFAWVNFGPPTDSASEQVKLLYLDPTKIIIDPPAHGASAQPGSVPLAGGVSVQSAGGLSNVAAFAYAGTPLLQKISALGGPTTGGTVLKLTGSGLSRVIGVAFVSELSSSYGASTSYNISAVSDRSVSVVTPADLPGPVDVLPCTQSACVRADPSVDTFVYYSPAGPQLVSLKPRSGPASGGTRVTVFGDNLDGAVAVRFGTHASSRIVAGVGYPDGDPYVLSVAAAPGRAGATVPVSVATRSGRSLQLSGGTFHYLPSAPSAPRALRVHLDGGTAVLRWSAPASNGGAPVTGYVAFAGAPGVAPEAVTVPPGARSAAFSGLVVGHAYSFRLAASNAAHGRGVYALRGPLTVGFANDGYRLATASGVVAGFGSLANLGGIGGSSPSAHVVGIAATSSGSGYWLATQTGEVYAFGDATNYGFSRAAAPVVAIAAAPTGDGYWLLSASGRVYGFGRARVFGSLQHRPDVGRAVALAASPDENGYWIATATGHVYAFGSAHAYGSPARRLGGAQVVALAPLPNGRGYWVATSTGAVFAFGEARSYGEPPAAALDGRVVGFAPAVEGLGYWLVTSTGAVYAFGKARYEGRIRVPVTSGVAGIAAL